MPSNAVRNKISANLSSIASLFRSFVLREANDKPQETVNMSATNDENSSTKLF